MGSNPSACSLLSCRSFQSACMPPVWCLEMRVSIMAAQFPYLGFSSKEYKETPLFFLNFPIEGFVLFLLMSFSGQLFVLSKGFFFSCPL